MHNGGRTKMATTSTLAIPANTSGTFLVGFIFDFVKERQSDLMESQLMTSNNNATLNIVSRIDIDAEQTDGELAHLLMPVWAYQSAAVYLIFISVLGLVMNIVVVLVIINDPQKMTPLNWMLLNLACSDGMIAGFGTPISAAAALQYNWPFSDELCVAYAMIMSTAGIGSITTLTALALWRCQLVVYCPAKRSGAFANHHSGGGGGGGSAKLGRVQAAVLLTLIWAYSLAVTCPPLFGWGRYDREAAHISCSVNWESKMANNRSYIFYMFAFGLFVPFLVIVVSYASILRVVKKTKEMRRKSQASMTGYNMHSKEKKSRRAESDSDHQHPSSTSTNKRKPRSKNKIKRSSNSDAAEKRVTVMVACMVGAFMAAWTPYSILALFETFIGVAGHSGGPGRNMSNTTLSLDGQQQFNDNQPTSNEADDSNFFYYYVGTISPAFATIPSLFAKTSAVLNPLIYGLLNTQFRSAWEKFTSRFLRPRPRRHHRRRRNSKDLAVNISGLAKPNRKKELWQFLNCAGGNSTSLRQSATVHLSMKEIVSNESQSAYVMANTVGAQQVVSARQGGDQEDQDQRRRPKNPANKTSCSSMSDPETSVTQEQTIQMKSFRHRHPLSVQQQQPEEQPAQEQKAATTTKLAAVGMISESTSCSCTNGDHNVVTTTTLEEEVSVFSADASAGAATTFPKSETHPQTVASVTSACPASIEAK